ncbi:DUF305 domain-containing protein [Streptomyces sp. RerS4]|uniref:DUF305 domain-containing protein n=1 Tax=Streptomyces sp. RerS4 TaxID=2942449 RepID=UPI00201C3849|nr:DUF305 domain-containing protein [Streptomyces sp. RerS4]UQX03998.1 DUF305 domain-containing protein [Streptomyces sp. RerS4]
MTDRSTISRSTIRRTSAVALAATAALVLAACGGNSDRAGGDSAHNGHSASADASPSASASAPGGNNAADTAFAQGMIPHHRQAVEMADLAATRAGSAEVKQLAEEIKKAQDPEIKTLSGWLTSWGEQVPAADAAGGGHGGHDGHTMSGMMTAEELDRLSKSTGQAFDTAFLDLMIKHHEGAVAMAKTEESQGRFQPAKDMAGAIVSSQSAEIARMKTLLGKN